MTDHHLIPFQFETHQLSVLIDDHGEPWWDAAEVCVAIDIEDVSRACSRLDEDEKQLISFNDARPISTRTFHSELKKLFVNEPGLYALILGSRKKSAKMFKRWITHEVIPQIRRTGSYSAHTRKPSTTGEMFLAQAHINVEFERRLDAIEHAQQSQQQQFDALQVSAPPSGRFSCPGWLKETGKPFLAHTLFENFKAACRRREEPIPYCPPYGQHAMPYYTPETLDAAYVEATKQLSFLPALRRARP